MTISHEVVECPTRKDYEKACNEFCEYAKTELKKYFNHQTTANNRESINYTGDVMEIMGCLSFVQVLAFN